jgi:serine/threonine protein kinase
MLQHNVLIDDHGTARIADFGCTRLIGRIPDRSRLVGSPEYMAPELFPNDITDDEYTAAPYSTMSDMYAFAMLSYQVFHIS